MRDPNTIDWIGSDKPRRLIIGLAGRARSGKTTVAEILENHGFKHVSFAHHIRLFVTQLASAVDPTFQLERDKNKPMWWAGGHTPRYLMQTIGTEWGRQLINPQLWVEHLVARIYSSHMINSHVVISDVRFDNEAQVIIDAGGIVINVVREGVDTTDGHVSEAGVSPNLIGATLYNNVEGLGYLSDTVFNVLKMLRENQTPVAQPTTTPENAA